MIESFGDVLTECVASPSRRNTPSTWEREICEIEICEIYEITVLENVRYRNSIDYKSVVG